MSVFEEVAAFYARYEGEKRIYGYSEEGRPLFALRTGRGETVGVSQYAIHGREWVTALLGLGHAARGVERGAVWILPLTNPDGAELAEKGLLSASEGRRDFLVRLNGGTDFSLWKANIEGVDLNQNFPARWGSGRQNVFSPAPQNYVGSAPLCARESRALARFTQEVRPRFTVSWHTKGEVIYWRFYQPFFRLVRDRRLARALSASTGYPLKEAKGSAGGYKDWCVEKLKLSAFTVETGRDGLPHPLTRAALPDLWEKNKDALARLTERI